MPSDLSQTWSPGRQPSLWVLLAAITLFSAKPFAAEKPYAPDAVPGALTVSAEQVIELTLSRPELVIIDARKKSEYGKGHIEGAANQLNTTMKQADLERLVPNKATPIVFYCNGIRCMRSSDAIRKATAWGYRNIFWFRGGWKEWTDKRLPVITD